MKTLVTIRYSAITSTIRIRSVRGKRSFRLFKGRTNLLDSSLWLYPERRDTPRVFDGNPRNNNVLSTVL